MVRKRSRKATPPAVTAITRLIDTGSVKKKDTVMLKLKVVIVA